MVEGMYADCNEQRGGFGAQLWCSERVERCGWLLEDSRSKDAKGLEKVTKSLDTANGGGPLEAMMRGKGA
jgi:hypothetical protein